MWTRSSVAESRQRRGRSRGRLLYGVLGRSRQVGTDPGDHSDRTRHVYRRTSFGLLLSRVRRRTKVETRTWVGESRRRNGKRVVTPTTERIKFGRRVARLGWRRSVGTTTEASPVGYEYPVLVRLGTLGLRRVVNSNDRIGRYLGIEWLSLTLYVMAGFRRGSAYSTEAGLKYYVIGSFGSAWILLGITRVYGWSGSRNRTEIERRRLPVSDGNLLDTHLFTLGWELILVAILLKLAGVPFHRWLADVYEGSPLPSVMYFTVIPKRGLVYLRSRRVGIWEVQDPQGRTGVAWRRALVSFGSITLGAIGALRQRRRKRFRAYSAISHTGYILLGVGTGTISGIQGVMTYTLIYMVMSRVRWQTRSVVTLFRGALDSDPLGHFRVRQVKYRTDRAYLAKENPARSGRVARTRMSMAGVPPLAGFVAKLSVFLPRIDTGSVLLARAGVRSSVIGAFNYIRMTKRMYFEPSSDVSRTVSVTTTLSKPRSRRRSREGLIRLLLGRNPTTLLILTHRIAESRVL